jgi:hypothetical protein
MDEVSSFTALYLLELCLAFTSPKAQLQSNYPSLSILSRTDLGALEQRFTGPWTQPCPVRPRRSLAEESKIDCFGNWRIEENHSTDP